MSPAPHTVTKQNVIRWDHTLHWLCQTNERHSRCICCPAPWHWMWHAAMCVPGRLYSAPSYSGKRRARHYRVGGPRARSRDRFTLKAMAREGAFVRREKRRRVKEGMALNSEMQNQIFLPKIFANHFEGGKENHKRTWNSTQMEETRDRLLNVNSLSKA